MNPEPDLAADRRRFYRIDDEVALRYREISRAELEAALRRLQLGYPDRIGLASAFAATSAQMHHAVERVRRDLPEVAGYLEGLNDKLDLLIQLMAASDAGLGDHPTHDVNLSASGISFQCAEALERGALLEIKLLIFPGYLCIVCFGEVVHRESAGEGRWRVGVDFSHIREVDRELIVRHITRRQSAILRDAHDAIDSAERADQPSG